MTTQGKKWSWLFAAGFILYMGIEVIFTSICGNLVGFHGRSYFSLAGLSSLWMGVVGGLLLIILGALNGIDFIKKQCLFIQSLLGALVITSLEFFSGCLLNLGFHLHIWDYSNLPFNLLGQINLLFSLFWFLLSPLAFWADDTLRWVFYKTGVCEEQATTYNLWLYYKQLFTFKPVQYLTK